MRITDQIAEAVAFIRKKYSGTPSIGVILGSGLGRFTEGMKIEIEVPYADIPHFPVSTVEGHKGRLIFGELGGKKLAVMAGRFHYYEGYSAAEVVFPVRVIRHLGVETLLLSNAAGGVHPDFSVGDLMVIEDHISFAIMNPLVGPNETSLGTRFPDMSQPYARHLIGLAKEKAAALGIELRQGVYFGVTGPTFETRAEYMMIKLAGADAVGMSTVQECIAAVHMGMTVFAVSVITDLGIRDDENVITHQEVLEAAGKAEPKLTALFGSMIEAL